MSSSPSLSLIINQKKFIFKRLATLRQEADNAITRAEEAEKKIKVYEQELLQKEQEIVSLNNRLGFLETENEKTEEKLKEYKASSLDSEHSKTTADTLIRKVQLLEEELDAAEKNLKETVDK